MIYDFDVFRSLPILLLAVFILGCPDNPQSLCDGVVCPTGEVCDVQTGQCRTQQLPLFDGPLPGRNVEIDAAGGLIFITTFYPVSRSVVGGVIDRESRDVRVLMQTERVPGKLGLEATNDRVAIAWPGPETYQIAWRSVRNTNAFWNFVDVSADRPYTPSSEFDILLGDRGVTIASRTDDGTLIVLEPESIDGLYQLSVVDDGGVSANGVSCPDEVRDTLNLGVGREPDMTMGPDREILVSYQDEDCGDLRLARRLNDEWIIDVVDTGESDGQPEAGQRGRVGRYSSVAVTPSGRAAIAYYDTSRTQLRFARSTDRGWEAEVVDPGLNLDGLARERKDVVGTFATLSFDERGVANITYQNASTHELRRASRSLDASRWVLRTIANEGLVGFSATHAYSLETGLIAAAERVSPGSSTYRSLLEVVWE